MAISGVTIGIGAGVLALAGIALAVRTRLFVRRAIRVRATVIDRLTSPHMGTEINTSPVQRFVVEFVDTGGRRCRVELREGLGGLVGERLVGADNKVAVLFDPHTPKVVRLASPVSLYFFPVVLMIPALMFTILVVTVLVAR
jgi:hypothetical protein